jgi:hypothetical protein
MHPLMEPLELVVFSVAWIQVFTHTLDACSYVAFSTRMQCKSETTAIVETAIMYKNPIHYRILLRRACMTVEEDYVRTIPYSPVLLSVFPLTFAPICSSATRLSDLEYY